MINNLSKSLNEKIEYNYIANDIIKFIKIFVNSHRIVWVLKTSINF